jgi:hypothetical protein
VDQDGTRAARIEDHVRGRNVLRVRTNDECIWCPGSGRVGHRHGQVETDGYSRARREVREVDAGTAADVEHDIRIVQTKLDERAFRIRAPLTVHPAHVSLGPVGGVDPIKVAELDWLAFGGCDRRFAERHTQRLPVRGARRQRSGRSQVWR